MTWQLALCLGAALGVSLFVVRVIADLCGDLEELTRAYGCVPSEPKPEPIRKRSALSEVR